MMKSFVLGWTLRKNIIDKTSMAKFLLALRWRCMIRNCIVRYQSLDISYVWFKIKDSRHFQLAIYTRFFMYNPNLESEWTNSFALRRKLRKINLWESRFLIIVFVHHMSHPYNPFKGPYQGGNWAPPRVLACSMLSRYSTTVTTSVVSTAPGRWSRTGPTARK